MSLRPLIEIAAESERVHALAGRVRAAAEGGEAVTVRASAMLRPLLLAALLEDDRGPRRPPDPAGQPPTTAPPATSPPTCAPTWPRAGSASIPRAAPATPRT